MRIYTVCHSFYFFWRHYFIVTLNCFLLRTTTVAGLGVPIFRVFTVGSVFACTVQNVNRLNHYFAIGETVVYHRAFSLLNKVGK